MSLFCLHSWRIFLLYRESLSHFLSTLWRYFSTVYLFPMYYSEIRNLESSSFFFQWEAVNISLFPFLFLFFGSFTMMCLGMGSFLLILLGFYWLLEFMAQCLSSLAENPVISFNIVSDTFCLSYLSGTSSMFDIFMMSSRTFTSLTYFPSFRLFWPIIQSTKSFLSCVSNDYTAPLSFFQYQNF